MIELSTDEHNATDCSCLEGGKLELLKLEILARFDGGYELEGHPAASRWDLVDDRELQTHTATTARAQGRWGGWDVISRICVAIRAPATTQQGTINTTLIGFIFSRFVINRVYIRVAFTSQLKYGHESSFCVFLVLVTEAPPFLPPTTLSPLYNRLEAVISHQHL